MRRSVTDPSETGARFWWVADRQFHARLPSPQAALTEPNGLLALGGDLSSTTLIQAYRQGIFPWFNDDSTILWWSPDPRASLFPEAIRVTRSLRRTLRRASFTLTADRNFSAVIDGCAAPRRGDDRTWITSNMSAAYLDLHELGVAHSVEVTLGGNLVGGLYGVALGRIFFGESMYSRVGDASKVALVTLARQLRRWGFALIDCQVGSAHLSRMGAMDMPRVEFLRWVKQYVDEPTRVGRWTLDDDL